MSGDASEPAAVIDDRDIAVMFFTSGTESMPKGVMSSHRNLYMASQTYVSEGTFLRDETFVLALPMIHVAGFVCAVTCFTTGAGLVLLELPVPGQIAAAMESYNATTTGLPPTLYLAVLNDPGTSSRDLTGMKKLVTWSSTIPKSMIDGWNELAPGARFLTVQASTASTACPITAGWFKEWDEVPGQDGRYIGEITYPAVDIRIVDEYGEEVPAGIAGEQLIRGPVVTAGYFENREADLKAFRDGWFHTGDIVARDEDGHLFFVDRKKDMVKSGGENVSSQEVESILGRHPDVLQCAVIGLPDAHWGEAVAAVIVKREGSTLNEDEVKTFCREYLAGFKTPKHVYFRRSLPVTSAGKLLKRALKDEFVAEPT
ncbi:class I adenylate-forming enzyme family protein [Edaphobacillus lindanitolerans]|nr:AMP-binding protein [Edaphobacillus lindanitolerans]